MLLRLVQHYPLILFLPAAGVGLCWLVGWATKPRRTNTARGAKKISKWSVKAWRNRQQLGRVALWTTGMSAALVWVVIVSASPSGWKPLLLLGSAALLAVTVAPRGPLERRLDGRSLTQAVSERLMASQVRWATNQVLEGTTVGRPQQGAGRLVIPAKLPAGATIEQLEAAAVGSALASRHIPAGEVEVLPGRQLDDVTLLVHDERPRAPWDILTELDNTWHPDGSEGDAPVLLGWCVNPVTGEVELVFWELDGQMPHALVAGATGGGKSGQIIAVFATLAHRRHVQIVALDPDAVEFDAFADRCLWVARGARECLEGMRWLYQLMEQRRTWLLSQGRRKWQVGVDGPLVVALVDELAGVAEPGGYFGVDMPGPDGKPLAAKKLADEFIGLNDQLAARARKYGIRLFEATQQPEADLFGSTKARNNFGTRLGLWMMEAIGARQILGDGAPDCTAIPKLKGAGYLLRSAEAGGRLYVPMRGALVQPKGPCADRDEALGQAAREIAKATAHLRSDVLTYEPQEASA